MVDDPIVATREQVSAETWRRGLSSIAALIASALLIALVVLVADSNRDRDVALARERQSYEVLVVIRALDGAMAHSEAALGRYVISGDRRTGALYYDEWVRAGRLLDRLRAIARADPIQAPLIARLDQLYRVRGGELAEPATRATYRQGWNALSLFNAAGEKTSIMSIASVIEQVADNERTRLGDLSDAAADAVARSNFLAALLSALGVLVGIGALALGWLTLGAMRDRAAARAEAEQESDRALTLGQAVATRTRELSDANHRLRAEAATRAETEARLRQAQKMEAVGRLTGGIAHDFNNMLAVVVGGIDLARRRLGDPAETRRHLDNALDGAARAAALTRRLLAFARAEPLNPEGVDPARLIAGLSDLLDRTLGERIVVELRGEGRWAVWADPHQIENALVNLAVNARDAMDGEGRLTIATADVTVADGEVGEARAGDYLRLDVSDTGCGMAPDVVARAFEPFFTTKPVGKGTGLGLSQIFGFARASGGEVAVRSAVGRGTTVSLYLPRYRGAVAAGGEALPEPVGSAPATAARVLLVEDDHRVRAATTEALVELGHEVHAVAGGGEALALLAQRRDFDLLVSDVVMPGMTGPQLIAQVERTHPALAVLFVTGYAGDAEDDAHFRGRDVLRKPFTVSGLAHAVEAALGRGTLTERAA